MRTSVELWQVMSSGKACKACGGSHCCHAMVLGFAGSEDEVALVRSSGLSCEFTVSIGPVRPGNQSATWYRE